MQHFGMYWDSFHLKRKKSVPFGITLKFPTDVCEIRSCDSGVRDLGLFPYVAARVKPHYQGIIASATYTSCHSWQVIHLRQLVSLVIMMSYYGKRHSNIYNPRRIRNISPSGQRIMRNSLNANCSTYRDKSS
jgi:hypothetical protein